MLNENSAIAAAISQNQIMKINKTTYRNHTAPLKFKKEKELQNVVDLHFPNSGFKLSLKLHTFNLINLRN